MKNALLLLSALFIFGSSPAFAQIPAGPDANPNKRMDCSTAGDIRDDAGSCVPIESYLSTGSNTVYWVDQRSGDNSNAGTKSDPWKTIQRANKRGQLAPGDAVIVRGGTYREVIRPTASGKSGARITYSAYPGEDVVVSGAVPANDGWTLHDGNIYKRALSFSLDIDCPWSDCTNLSWRRELLVVNGKLQNQVGAVSNIDEPGEFSVDGFPPETPSKWIYARFPNDKSPSNIQIELGYESILFLPEGTQERTCKGDNGHYRLIGLNFRHSPSYRQAGAVCPGSVGSLVEEITVESNNALGINVSGQSHVLRGNTAYQNGQEGIGGGCDTCLLEYNESSANNWRGHPRGYSGGGGKFANTNGMTIRFHLARDNKGRGLWFDKDNYNNTVENSFFINNSIAGLHLEYNSNHNLVRNNVFYGTRWDSFSGSGILSHAANNNVIVFNSFISNEGTGLWIRYNNRAEDGYNKIYNNLFVNNATTGDVNNAYEIAMVAETNELDGNMYWSHEGLGRPTFQYATGKWTGNDIETWRELTGQDQNARVAARNSALIESMSSGDGWRLVQDSKAIAEAVALPLGIDPVLTDIDGDSRDASGADVGSDQYYAEDVDDAESLVLESEITIGEAGTVEVSQADGTEWHSVSLLNSYATPVVVMGPLTANGFHPSTVRVRNVTSTSFEFQIDEWDYLDGSHTLETTGYLVVEAGIHTLEDGRVIQAGRTPAGADETSVAFAAPFTSTPVVLTQVGTVNHSNALVTRQSEVTLSGFSVLLQAEEAGSVAGGENVGWIAMDRGTGSTGGSAYETRLTAESVAGKWSGVTFGQSFSSIPAVMAAMQTTNGMDPAGLRFQNATSAGFEVMVEEEKSKDLEVNHGPESVGYVAFETGSITAAISIADSGPATGETGTLAVVQAGPSEWHRLEFDQTYVDPVVVFSKLTYNGPQPFTVRVRNVTSTGCEFQIDEWDYLDGVHASETLGYLVVEAGTHTLDDGRVLQAGYTTAGSAKSTVAFPQAFTSRPIVLSQISSVSDPQAAVTRQADVSSDAFTLFLQSQESVVVHGDEKVGWIAMNAGTGTTGGRHYEAGRTGDDVSDSWYDLAYMQDYSASPVLLADMQTTNGLDIAGLRLRNLSTAGVHVSVEEEQSANTETRHLGESVGYMVFEPGLIETGSADLDVSAKTASSETLDQQSLSLSVEAGVPQEFALYENYPNPFNPRTTIRYDLPAEVHVQVEVFDVTGRLVAMLANGPQEAGTHQVHFDATDQASGLYLYRMKAGSFVQTGRMILLK